MLTTCYADMTEYPNDSQKIAMQRFIRESAYYDAIIVLVGSRSVWSFVKR